ncbi:hypothetical protein P389DRAFT_61992 [Cystobasidium minutum MCA 4210]|uniref:uncharacterized protein n=1 Tax=Cystobasidium minutum MCA 4210 TaxID=1397322 RepID=UPI0034CEF453|eukprot:jgi/Rhomi1/61992/CE61991_102
MSRQKMSTWTLGAIMLIVPTSFYLGTALNRHYTITQPVPSSPSASSTSGSTAAELKHEPSSPPLAVSSPGVDDVTMLQSRLKSLKTSRHALEMELKDNKEKLRRLHGRIQKEADKQAGMSAS